MDFVHTRIGNAHTLSWNSLYADNKYTLMEGLIRYNTAGEEIDIKWTPVQHGGSSYDAIDKPAGAYRYRLIEQEYVSTGGAVIPIQIRQSVDYDIHSLVKPQIIVPERSLTGDYAVAAKGAGIAGSTLLFDVLDEGGNWVSETSTRFNVVTGFEEWDFSDQSSGTHHYRAVATYRECDTLDTILKAFDALIFGSLNDCAIENRAVYASVEVDWVTPVLTSDSTLGLTWEPVDEAPFYIIEQQLGNGNWTVVGVGEGSQWSETIVGARYRVSACISEGTEMTSPRQCTATSEVIEYQFSGVQAPLPPVVKPVGLGFGDDTIGSLEGKFRVNEAGAATYSIPIMAAAGTAGVAPSISLNYSSQAGNGIAGKGWSIGGGSAITRCRQTLQIDGQAKPITWTNEDRFCLDGQRLLVQNGAAYGSANATYRTEIDSFAKVTSVGSAMGHPDSFIVTRKDGSTSFYGDDTANSASKQTVDSGSKTLTWAINEFRDSVGNPIKFVYHNDVNGFALSKIYYAFGAVNEAVPADSNSYIEFIYDTNRADPRIGFIAGYPVASRLLLTNIKSYTDFGGLETLLRQYNLDYENLPDASEAKNNLIHRLASIEECEGNGSCREPSIFDWGHTVPLEDVEPTMFYKNLAYENRAFNYRLADINGDGKQDVVWLDYSKDGSNLDQYLRYALSDGTQFSGTITQFRDGESPNDSTLTLEVIDYNLDGRSDIVLHQSKQGRRRLFLSTPQSDVSWTLQDLGYTPISGDDYVPFGRKDLQYADLNSDGLVDAWYIDANTNTLYFRYFERNIQKPVTSPLAYHFGPLQTQPITFPADTNTLMSPIDVSGKSFTVKGVADFDGDGRQEIYGVLTYRYSYRVREEHGSYQNAHWDYNLQYSSYVVVYEANSMGVYQRVLTIPAESSIHNGEHSSSPKSLDDKYKANKLLHVADFNADGLSDFIIKNGQWNLYLSEGRVGQLSIPKLIGVIDTESLSNTDLNGDGYQDLYWKSGTSAYLRYWQPALEQFSDSVSFDTIGGNSHFSFAELNGESGLEKVSFNSDNSHIYFSSYETLPNGHENIHTVTNGLGAVTSIEYESLSATDNYVRVEGINTATEMKNICYYTCWEYPVTVVNADEFYMRLNDPFYDLPTDASTLHPETSAPILELLAPINVVTRVESSAPAANATPNTIDYEAKSAISYIYHQAKMQAGGRGYLGFKKVETVDEQTGVRTSTEYRQDFPFIGMPIKTEVHTANGDLLSQSTNNWQLKSFAFGDFEPANQGFNNAMGLAEEQGCSVLGSLQPWLKESVEQSFSTTTADPLSISDGFTVSTDVLQTVVTKNTQIDKHGNVISNVIETYTGSRDTGTLLKSQTTSNTYAPTGWPTDAKRFGRLSSTTVVHDIFDGEEPISRTSDFTYYTLAEGGLLKTGVIEPDSDEFRLTTLYEYDEFGNKEWVTQTAANDANGAVSVAIAGIGTIGDVANARYSKWVYDALGRFVNKTENSLGQIVQEVTERNEYGLALKAKNIDGIVTEAYYTPFGKPYLNYAPTGAWSHTSYGNCIYGCPIGAAYSVTTKQAGGGQSTQYFDVLGRTIQTEAIGFDGRVISTQTEYDAIGRVVRQSTPYYYEYDRYWAETSYDILGRPIKILQPHGLNPIEQSVSYNGFTTTTSVTSTNLSALLSGSSETSTQIVNALGEMVSVTDALNGVVSYTYDAQGNLLTTTTTAHANGGNVANGIVPTSITILLNYDDLGRKISMDDPDKGYWEYTYNGFGELIEQIDAKGNVTNMSYDALDRMVVREDWLNQGGDPATPNLILEGQFLWCYDLNGWSGKLVKVVDMKSYYTKQYAYDNFGRQVSSVTTIYEGGYKSFSESVTYDQYGRVFQKFDATGNNQGTHYRYAATGYLQSVQEANAVNGEHQTYFTIQNMTARGQVSEVRWGNGALSTRRYDKARGTPKELKTYLMLGLVEIQNLALDFDDFGNLVSRHNQGLGLAANSGGTAKNLLETFTYDKLNRLRSSTVNNGVAQTLTYDSFGNIKNKSDVGTYAYGEAANDNFAGPHAVSSVVTANGTEVYRYDRNGNLTSDTSANGGRTLVYSSFDKPVSITKGNHNIAFSYGPNRARYKRVDTNSGNNALSKTTYYMGNVERIIHADGSVEHKRYIEGQILVTDTLANVSATLPTNSTIQYLIKDHLGSTALVLNHDVTNGGFVAADMSFDAWGKRRQGIDWEPMAFTELLSYMAGTVKETTNKGFTGHEQLDEVGLVHMNGRIYDPRLARFMQADPFIQSPGNTQSYNRYSYVFNNPLAYTDPSGYFSFKDFVIIVVVIVISVVTYGIASGAAIGAYGASCTAVCSIATANIVGGVAGGAAAGFAAGVSMAAFSGASLGDAFKAGIRGAVTGAITGGFGGYASTFSKTALGSVGKIGVSALGGCAAGKASGGSCNKGAKLAAMAQALSIGIEKFSQAKPTWKTPSNKNGVYKPSTADVADKTYCIPCDVIDKDANNVGIGVRADTGQLLGSNTSAKGWLSFQEGSMPSRTLASFPGFNSGAVFHDPLVGFVERSAGINNWSGAAQFIGGVFTNQMTIVPAIGANYIALGALSYDYYWDNYSESL